jgi:hypothetical protein
MFPMNQRIMKALVRLCSGAGTMVYSERPSANDGSSAQQRQSPEHLHDARTASRPNERTIAK